MDELRRLAGAEVTVRVTIFKGAGSSMEEVDIKCVIDSINVNTFRFEESGDALFISISATPLEELPEGVEIEEFEIIDPQQITKSHD